MRVLIISYDLMQQGQNYERLSELVKSYDKWARLGGSAYLIYTDSTPKQVRDRLREALDSNDKLYVGVSPAPSAWVGISDNVSNWIISNQK